MIPIPERQQIVHWVAEASAAGARRHQKEAFLPG